MISVEKGQVVWRMSADDAEGLACDLPRSWQSDIGCLFAAVDEIRTPTDQDGPGLAIVVVMEP